MSLRNRRGQFRKQHYCEKLSEKIKPVVYAYFIFAGFILHAFLFGYAVMQFFNFLKQNNYAPFVKEISIIKGREFRARANRDVPVSAESNQSVPETDNSVSSIEERIRKAFGEDGEIAVAIAKAESGLDGNRIGDKHLVYWQGDSLVGMSCGIFQVRVLPGRPSCDELLDVETNIEWAKKLYDQSGFYPWTTFKNGQYKNYL